MLPNLLRKAKRKIKCSPTCGGGLNLCVTLFILRDLCGKKGNPKLFYSTTILNTEFTFAETIFAK